MFAACCPVGWVVLDTVLLYSQSDAVLEIVYLSLELGEESRHLSARLGFFGDVSEVTQVVIRTDQPVAHTGTQRVAGCEMPVFFQAAQCIPTVAGLYL